MKVFLDFVSVGEAVTAETHIEVAERPIEVDSLDPHSENKFGVADGEAGVSRVIKEIGSVSGIDCFFGDNRNEPLQGNDSEEHHQNKSYHSASKGLVFAFSSVPQHLGWSEEVDLEEKRFQSTKNSHKVINKNCNNLSNIFRGK